MLDALGLDEFALALEELHLVSHLGEDVFDGFIHDFRVDDVVGGRVDGGMLQNSGHFAGEGVDLADAVDLIAKVFDADGVLGLTRREDLHGVSADTELGSDEVDVVTLVVQFDELFEQRVSRVLHAGPQRDDHVFVVDGRTDGVDAGDRRHDDDVSPFTQSQGGRVAHLVDFVVNGRVFFNIGVGGRDIRLRLVVIVVRDEVLDRVVREQFLELRTQLTRQSLVVGQDQRGAIGLRDDVRHREGLAGAGDALQRLLFIALVQAVHEGGDGFRLVAGGLVGRYQFKVVHSDPPSLNAVGDDDV